MSDSTLIETALCLPIPDIEALTQGRMIVCMSRMYTDVGQVFALYPSDTLASFLLPEKHYRPNFLSIVIEVLKSFNYQQTLVKAWARCEQCKALANISSLEILSDLTIWKTEALEEILAQYPNTFLTYLRVYPLHLEMAARPVVVGDFISLPRPQSVPNASPVLSDRIFAHRKQQLEELRPPLHPELEDLFSAVALVANNDLATNKLKQDIRAFLGWTEALIEPELPQDLAWIKTIVTLGNRSKELDQGKSNYQAGTDFEIIVRQGLEFLGFTVDDFYKGGAGGLDLFCSKPYYLVGECKAGKNIPDRAVEELDRIGKRHLKENYLNAIRLIIGSGQPTKNLQESAKVSKISIISAMSLEKLVQLQVKHRNSVDLIELKKYLEFGQIDHKIDQYVEKVLQRIKLRSYIVGLVKKHLENTGDESVGVEIIYGAYSNQSQPIKRGKIHEILVELSSPLTGYLGRIEGEEPQNDRFYFLRDL